MSNNKLIPIYRIEKFTPVREEELIKQMLLQPKNSLYQFSLGQYVKKQQAVFKFQLLNTALLRVHVGFPESAESSCVITITPARLILVVYGLQIIVTSILAGLSVAYLEAMPIKYILILLPFLIYLVLLLNFHFFRSKAMSHMRKFLQ